MTFPRRLEPEWLDILPADDPQAIGSRRDLRLVNNLMFNVHVVARALGASQFANQPPQSILEIGSGDGTWMLGLARRLAPRWTGVKVTLLDRQDLLSNATRLGFERLGWQIKTVTGDVFACFENGTLSGHDIVLANLFLHHLSFEELSSLFKQLAFLTKLHIACEPRRATLPLLMSHMLWAVGCNKTTRHDAVASVRAGFNDNELSQCWPGLAGWTLAEYPALPFSHCFVARHE